MRHCPIGILKEFALPALMSMQSKQYTKGDVVLVMFPYTSEDGQVSTKRRPGVVVSDESASAQSDEVTLVPLTSATAQARPKEKQIFVSMRSPEGQAGGLRLDCLIDCTVVARIPKGLIATRIGRFPESTLRSIEEVIGDTDGH